MNVNSVLSRIDLQRPCAGFNNLTRTDNLVAVANRQFFRLFVREIEFQRTCIFNRNRTVRNNSVVNKFENAIGNNCFTGIRIGAKASKKKAAPRLRTPTLLHLRYDISDGSARRGGQSVFSFIELLNAFEAIDAGH